MAQRLHSWDAIVAVAILVVLGWLAVASRTETMEGSVRVVDGDTLDLSGRRIRLKGMDAPELAQTCDRAGRQVRCGEDAREALRTLTRGHAVTCRVTGQDRYRRALAVCRAEDFDLGAALVRRGLAVAFGAYEAEEAAARGERIGLWAGTFELPSSYRRRQARPE